MDCFKSATNSNPDKSRKQHKQQQHQPPAVPKRSSSERPQNQFDMPYDPIDLGQDETGQDLLLLEAPEDSRQQPQRDWWETLFPARFALDSDDAEANVEGNSDAQLRRDDFMVETGRHGNAYRRVWERLQREEAAAAAAAATSRRLSSDSSAEDADTTSGRQSRRRQRRRNSLQDGDAAAEASTTTDCLWTPEELRLFRNELAKLKRENHVLKAAVRFQADRLRCLDAKCRSQSRQLDAKSGAAGESAKASERYRILAQGLQARADEAERRSAELRAELDLVVEQRDQARAEAIDTGQRLQQLGAKLARLRKREAGVRDELARDFAVREDQLRADQANQLRQLEDSLADLRAELRKERYLHSATRLGHQQLLSHFSSSSTRSASANNGSHGDTLCSACGGGGGGVATASESDIRLF